MFRDTELPKYNYWVQKFKFILMKKMRYLGVWMNVEKKEVPVHPHKKDVI